MKNDMKRKSFAILLFYVSAAPFAVSSSHGAPPRHRRDRKGMPEHDTSAV